MVYIFKNHMVISKISEAEYIRLNHLLKKHKKMTHGNLHKPLTLAQINYLKNEIRRRLKIPAGVNVLHAKLPHVLDGTTKKFLALFEEEMKRILNESRCH